MKWGQMGPDAPEEYRPRKLTGRLEEERPSFLQDTGGMLTNALADVISTEAVRRGGGQEDNPVLRKLQVKGSNVPSMIGGSLIQAFLAHKLGKKHPNIAHALKTVQTSASGTLAGQNASLLGKGQYKDDRIRVFGRR